MKTTTAPMSAVEAQRLDVAYTAVAKSLGLPSQAYMALSDSKFLDAQAGAETFGSALLAALAGVNSVSGPGMLDYVLTFSLAKLVFDDEMCGQALAFVRDAKPLADLPTLDLARELLAKQHLLTAEHTLAHWPQELYLPGSVIDRENRDNWRKAGRSPLEKRAHDEVERRLAAYEAPETDPRIDAEMRRIIQSGMAEKRPLPAIPPLAKKPTQDAAAAQRARRPRPRRREN
jgi:trimethylamine--corrinoid protein Co-methyltransferase